MDHCNKMSRVYDESWLIINVYIQITKRKSILWQYHCSESCKYTHKVVFNSNYKNIINYEIKINHKITGYILLAKTITKIKLFVKEKYFSFRIFHFTEFQIRYNAPGHHELYFALFTYVLFTLKTS